MSGKHCGPSKGLLDLDTKIGSAMDDLQNNSIGTGAAGIADSIGGLKDSLKSKTDGILADLDAAVPEIPKPKANLQEQMTKLMSSLDNPGLVLSEIEGIKLNFGSVVNVDDMLKNAGVDPSKIEGLSNEFNKLQTKAKLQNVGGSLAKLATGDLSAVKNLMGGLPQITLPGKDPAGIVADICKDVPNLDLDADGKVIKKGVETKVATEDAEPIEEPSEKKDTPPPEKDRAPAERLEQSKTVILNPNTEEAAKIHKEEVDEKNERYFPVKKEWTVLHNKAIDLRSKAETIRNKKTKRVTEASAIKFEKESDAIRFLGRMIEKDIFYNTDVKKVEAGLIKGPAIKPTITHEEIHERTNFSNFPKVITKIEALPNLVIKGDKPPRVNLDG